MAHQIKQGCAALSYYQVPSTCAASRTTISYFLNLASASQGDLASSSTCQPGKVVCLYRAARAATMPLVRRPPTFVALCILLSCCTSSASPSFQVPWTVTINAKLWVFQTAPLATRPQPTPSQRPSSRWTFEGGPGVILVAQYEDAPLLNNKTSYSELVYIPGRYQPCTGSQDAYYSVARMFVDDTHARGAGRSVWGYPKEMARFVWSTEGNSTRLRVNRQGKLIFRAKFTDSASSGPFLPPWLLGDQRVIQVPIPRNASDPTALWRNSLQYSFSSDLPSKAAVTGLFVDTAAFTNDTSLSVVPLAAKEVVRLPLGASGSLPAPESFKC